MGLLGLVIEGAPDKLLHPPPQLHCIRILFGKELRRVNEVDKFCCSGRNVHRLRLRGCFIKVAGRVLDKSVSQNESED